MARTLVLCSLHKNFSSLGYSTFCTNRDKGPDKLDLAGSKKLHFYAKEQDVNLC